MPEKAEACEEAAGQSPFTFTLKGPQPIATVTVDNRVEYKGRPITHEELCEAMQLWLVFKGDLPLRNITGGYSAGFR